MRCKNGPMAKQTGKFLGVPYDRRRTRYNIARVFGRKPE